MTETDTLTVETEPRIILDDEETVECDSCGQRVPEDDAETFVVGDILEMESPTPTDPGQLIFEQSDVVIGKCCQYCREEPLSYPQAALELEMGIYGFVYGLIGASVFWVLVGIGVMLL